LKGTELMGPQHEDSADMGLVKSVGRVLFSDYLLPFEVSSVLLLASMVGAVMLGKSEKTSDSK